MSTVLTEAPAAKSASKKQPFVLKGVMQAPVTPLHDDFSVDYDGLEKMVNFHVVNGAPAIAWPHHKAESPNLTMEERKKGAEVLIKTVARRVPVSIFVGSLSEEDSLDLTRHAEKAGADMLLTISPYCRRPTQEEIFHSIVRIGEHTDLPVLTYLRDTQVYVQAAAAGMTIFDLPRSRAERDLEQWQAIIDWVESGDRAEF